jgi:hypothetical protein
LILNISWVNSKQPMEYNPGHLVSMPPMEWKVTVQ